MLHKRVLLVELQDYRQDNLTELAEAARTVSIALGRDVTDSFNRLVRGVTKAEPELLDELGIILRLEEATTKYAASLGLNKNPAVYLSKITSSCK